LKLAKHNVISVDHVIKLVLLVKRQPPYPPAGMQYAPAGAPYPPAGAPYPAGYGGGVPQPGGYYGAPAQAPQAPPQAAPLLFSVHTPDNYSYQFAPFQLTPGDVAYINVQAKNDAHVLLSADAHGAQGSPYEIVLGGWGNSKSVLRRGKQGTELAAHSGSVLSRTEYRGFLVTQTPQGEILVGQQTVPGQYNNIILRATDTQPMPVNYIGMSTGWGSTGIFHVTVVKAARPYY
jgi:hypothetical protein